MLEHRLQVTQSRGDGGEPFVGRAMLISQPGEILIDLRLDQTTSSRSVMLSPGRTVPVRITDA